MFSRMERSLLSGFLRSHSKDQLKALIEAATDELNSRDKPLGSWKKGPPAASASVPFTSLFAPVAPIAPVAAIAKVEKQVVTSLCVKDLVVEEVPRPKASMPLYQELRQDVIVAMRPVRSSNVYVPQKGGYAIIDFAHENMSDRENEQLTARALTILKKKYAKVELYFNAESAFGPSS